MGKKINSSMITALAAGVVSVSALGVSVYEAYLQRAQHRASVLPIIETWTGYSSESFSINVANKGIGPARVLHVQVTRDGEAQPDWAQAFAPALGERSAYFAQRMLTGNVMTPEESAATVTFEGVDVAAKAWQASTEMQLEVCYCSVFDDCWMYRLDDLVSGFPETAEIENCPVELQPRF